ncbi:hypothetical protein NG796_24690 [Laspinema sp. A4]|uniref:hypothetical protein n=1 Tax=Laspinema sp. D2d TaxID=2953686 RepID=UPI0021BAF8CD|nr:hypothetical protein [Laspinema sp. D2d]MCT7986474.1 hypothetical protein [Laspinema sp. D2d]
MNDIQQAIHFIKQHQVEIAAFSWSCFCQDGAGAVDITILPGRLQFEWLSADEADRKIAELISRCNFQSEAIAVFADRTAVKFTPSMPPANCWDAIATRSQEFVRRAPKGFQW